MAHLKLELLSGTINGEGHQANCTVSCRVAYLPGTTETQRQHYNVESCSEELPDGNYIITIHGDPPFGIRKVNGFWLAPLY